MLDVMNKQVLSVLFLGAPAWFGQLTIAEKTHLNRGVDSTDQLIKLLQVLLTNRPNTINSESGSNTDLKT